MAKKLKISDIKEVETFVAAQERLEKIREMYEQELNIFTIVAEEYNTALVAADKAVRATGCSCGPFELTSVSESYDPQMLRDLLGERGFYENGGGARTVVTLEVDKNKIKAAIINGKIPEDIAERCIKRTLRYKKPSEVSL